MKADEFRRRAFAMPPHSPSFPPGPYRFAGREYMTIAYPSDMDAVKRIVPEPLEPIEPVVRLEFVRMPDSTGFGAYALLDSLRADGRSAAPPTVYRALEFLLALGLVHRVESLNAYLGCAHPASDHAAQFLICRQCGTAAELEESDIATAIDRHAKRAGFAVERRTVEAMGLCAACQTA